MSGAVDGTSRQVESAQQQGDWYVTAVLAWVSDDGLASLGYTPLTSEYAHISAGGAASRGRRCCCTGNVQGCSRVMARPVGGVGRPSIHHGPVG